MDARVDNDVFGFGSRFIGAIEATHVEMSEYVAVLV